MGIGRDGLMNSCWSWVRLLRKALRVVMAWRETWRETRTKTVFNFPITVNRGRGRILFLKNTPMQRSKYLDTDRVRRIPGGGSYLLLLWGPAEWLWPADDPLFLPACSLGGQTLRPARTAPQTHPRHIYLKATHHIYHIFVTPLCIKNVLTLYLWTSGPWKMQ